MTRVVYPEMGYPWCRSTQEAYTYGLSMPVVVPQHEGMLHRLENKLIKTHIQYHRCQIKLDHVHLQIADTQKV